MSRDLSAARLLARLEWLREEIQRAVAHGVTVERTLENEEAVTRVRMALRCLTDADQILAPIARFEFPIEIGRLTPLPIARGGKCEEVSRG